MKSSSVRSILAVLLVATLVAAYFVPSSTTDDAVELSEHAKALPAARAPSAAAPTPLQKSVSNIQVLTIRSRDTEDSSVTGVFASSQWTPPAPKVVAKAAVMPEIVSVPQAPTLPFRVLGRYVEDGKTVVFLQYNEQNLAVRVGDTIAQNYKVESLEGDALTLRYLPLNQQQTLNVGSH